eukprot:1162051-Pelagomonas_calceolata.AAC.1
MGQGRTEVSWQPRSWYQQRHDHKAQKCCAPNAAEKTRGLPPSNQQRDAVTYGALPASSQQRDAV